MGVVTRSDYPVMAGTNAAFKEVMLYLHSEEMVFDASTGKPKS